MIDCKGQVGRKRFIEKQELAQGLMDERASCRN